MALSPRQAFICVKNFPDESHGTIQCRGHQNAEGGVLAKLHCLGITGILHYFPLRWGWFGCGLVTVSFSHVRPNPLCQFSSPRTWDCPGAPCQYSPQSIMEGAFALHKGSPWALKTAAGPSLLSSIFDWSVKTKCPEKATESEKYVFPSDILHARKGIFSCFLPPVPLVKCEFYH